MSADLTKAAMKTVDSFWLTVSPQYQACARPVKRLGPPSQFFGLQWKILKWLKYE